MSDLWMALVAGLLGSTHCVGMCGGFAVALAVSRQHVALYHTGRVLGYAALGALAGALGQALDLGGAVLGVRRLPLFLAAGFLIVFGLAIAGVLPRRWVEPGGGGVQRLLGAILRRRDRRAAFLFGTANALLPCGLLYPVYALAAGTASPLRGAGLLLCFGAGTVPLLASVSAALARLGVATRVRFFRVAGIAMVLYGMWLGWRGWAGRHAHAAMPATPPAHGPMR
jgi:sulfite exporter TauE/SafE